MYYVWKKKERINKILIEDLRSLANNFKSMEVLSHLPRTVNLTISKDHFMPEASFCTEHPNLMI